MGDISSMFVLFCIRRIYICVPLDSIIVYDVAQIINIFVCVWSQSGRQWFCD